MKMADGQNMMRIQHAKNNFNKHHTYKIPTDQG
jgi:hypothetical protein